MASDRAAASESEMAAARISAIIRNSDVAIIGRDLTGTIISWNAGAERLYGYQQAEVVGRHGNLLAGADCQEIEASLLTRIISGERVKQVRTRHLHRDGHAIDVSVSVSPIVDHNDLIVGMASTYREVGELVQAESRFQGMLEAAPDAMVTVDSEGSITSVNGQVEKLFGYTRAELIGRPVDVLVPAAARPTHPGLREAYLRDPANRPMGGYRTQLSGQRKDGTTFPADISLGSIRIDGKLTVTAAVRDVSERIAVQTSLRESEANFRQFTDSVDVAFMLSRIDPPEFIYVSQGFAKIYGYDPMSAGESPQTTLLRTHPDDLAEMQRTYWDPIRLGQPAHSEFRIIRSDGEIRSVLAISRPVRDNDGAIRRYASTAEDITERKLAEAAMRRAHTHAQQANSAKNEFLSRMSHELRTPLNAVLGFAQLLELDDLTTSQQDAVQFILRGGRHLLGLIDDVLDITKIETDRLELSIEPIQLAQLVGETIQFMTPLAATMDVSLRWHPHGGAVRYVQADRRRLRQVLLNLLSNAIKYNRRGGSVDVCCREISGAISEIEVRDTGRGIAAQDLPRLFTPFDRLGAQDIGIEGTGVGLALSQRLMTNMGGSLRAESQQDVGCTFIASIATAGAPALSDIVDQDVPAESADSRHEQARRLLVYVEDNESNVDLMVSLLRRRTQWRMHVAHNGLTGIDLIDAELPEMVLLDLHLPELEGIEVLLRLRANPRTSKLRIVIVSADASPHQMRRLLAAGADDYITKPLDVSRILQLLDFVDQPELQPDEGAAREGG